MCSKLLYYNELNIEAPVAQLDRASVYGTGSWGFESLQACFFFVGVIQCRYTHSSLGLLAMTFSFGFLPPPIR